MTVQDYINEHKDIDDLYIKLGSREGGGFIYCGRIEDMQEFLNKFDKPYIERLEGSLALAVRDHTNLLNGGYQKIKERFLEQYKEYQIRKAKNGDDFKKNRKFEPFKTAKAYAKHLDKLEVTETHKAAQRVERANARLQNYTTILGREVVETYQSILINEDGFLDEIVIYQGAEGGSSWDLSEFRRGGGDFDKNETQQNVKGEISN